MAVHAGGGGDAEICSGVALFSHCGFWTRVEHVGEAVPLRVGETGGDGGADGKRWIAADEGGVHGKRGFEVWDQDGPMNEATALRMSFERSVSRSRAIESRRLTTSYGK